ncbi:LOW QUALITY PROTEIN: KAT8 regulatory NSL complex subunit 1-like [Menidia menidia]
MAAMAPALTDAPAEAHHIRFKLAAPSSSLSPPSSAAGNPGNPANLLLHATGNPGNLLLHAGGPSARRKPVAPAAAEDFGVGVGVAVGNGEEPQQPPPLVASYLCSDVTPVPSSKESLTLTGVLLSQSVLKGHRLLPGALLNGNGNGGSNGGGDFLLRKRPALELKGLKMSGSSPNGGGQTQTAPVNGLAKRLSSGSSSGCVVAVNGDKPAPVTSDSPPTDAEALAASASGHDAVPAATAAAPQKQQQQKHSSSSSSSSTAVSPETDGKSDSFGRPQGCRGDREQPPQQPGCSAAIATTGLESHVRERALLNGSRQAEIEGRLRRLRKRLQVVQAKQAERHVQQQLGGFMDAALSRLLATGATGGGRHASSGGGGTGNLGRFLKGGAMPLELERLYLSGTANLRSAESAFDSDVTESSSGGDSDLEEEELARADLEQRHVKIWKRAESRYTVERAAIISHWNWLQAHISDLEYRIRQQTDIYRQIRASKGSVELGGSAPGAVLTGGAEVKAEPGNTQDVGSERLELAGAAHSADQGSWKGQNGQPVNGVLSRMADGAESKPPLALDGSCVAARTRPLVGCRRRRLIQPNAVPNLNGKAPRSSCVQCSCRVNPHCVMCGGWPTPREDPQYELPTLDRLSRLDLGIHPILSFPDDVCIGLRLQQVMKSQWQTKSLERSKPLKKLSLKHKLSSSKEKHKFTNSLMAVRLGQFKSRSDRPRPPASSSDGGGGGLLGARLDGQSGCRTERLHGLSAPPFDRGYGRKRGRELSLERPDASPKLLVEAGSPCPPLPSVHALHSPLTRQLSTSSENSAPPGAASTPQPIKRRRGESSFDINNIVIPMSVAATTRVEKLQYKEILTPSWRSVDIFCQPITEEENDREVEDLTDAAFVQLHQPYEDQERSRWTWMALAPAKRRGSRSYKSVDGRTTPLLCGTNPPTPQPASPDPAHLPLLHDYSQPPSPPSPPSADDASNPQTPGSQRLLSSEDTRCSTPDFCFEERTVAPWERRCFPLPEDPLPEPDPDPEPPRPRARSISGCRATAFGRPDSDDTETPCEEDGGVPKQRGSAHR